MSYASRLFNNRYLTLEELGCGGFGCTFLALDTHMPSKPKCVVKQLVFETDDAGLYDLVQTRFQREAAVLEVLGKVSSQIPSLYACSHDGANLYLVQEWIDGLSLQQKLDKDRSLDDLEVTEILVQLLSVLELIHSKNVIHRDIKPANIMVRADDGKPVLIDFGAVKEVIPITAGLITASSRTVFIGTPQFAPIEQHEGRPTFASDLYSLGLTAICLLTGRQPAWRETDLAAGKPVVRRFRPGNWYEYAPNVNNILRSALDKAIEPVAANRYQNAREMRSALRLRRSASARSARVSHTSNDRLVALVQQYNQLREHFADVAKLERRELMKGIFNEMVKLIVEDESLNTSIYLNSNDWGMRLAAYVYLYIYPRVEMLPDLISSVSASNDQPFVQYRGLEAIEKILARYSSDEPEILDGIKKLRLLRDTLDPTTQRRAELERILMRHDQSVSP